MKKIIFGLLFLFGFIFIASAQVNIGVDPGNINGVYISSISNQCTLTCQGNSSFNQTFADDRYVNVAGDTMTGGLNITNGEKVTFLASTPILERYSWENQDIDPTPETVANSLQVREDLYDVGIAGFYSLGGLYRAFIPEEDNLVDLGKEALEGTPALSFKDLYLKGNIYNYFDGDCTGAVYGINVNGTFKCANNFTGVGGSSYNATYNNLLNQQGQVAGQVVNGTYPNGTFIYTSVSAVSSGGNPFNQVLNTTSNVTHYNLIVNQLTSSLNAPNFTVQTAIIKSTGANVGNYLEVGDYQGSYPNYVGSPYLSGGSYEWAGLGLLMNDNANQFVSTGGDIRFMTNPVGTTKSIAYSSKDNNARTFIFTADTDAFSIPPNSTVSVGGVTYTVKSAGNTYIKVIQDISAAPASGTLTGIKYARSVMTIEDNGNITFPANTKFMFGTPTSQSPVGTIDLVDTRGAVNTTRLKFRTDTSAFANNAEQCLAFEWYTGFPELYACGYIESTATNLGGAKFYTGDGSGSGTGRFLSMTLKANGNVELGRSLNVTGKMRSLNATGLNGFAMCYLSNGEFGHCTNAVNSTGGCTCVAN